MSLGFNPGYILECAEKQAFQVDKCIYDRDEQRKLIGQVIDSVEALAGKGDDNSDSHRRTGSERSYHDIFQQIESDLLRIAAVLKHPSFREEEEWRIVSPVITDYRKEPVLFREGASMLVPYIEFNLATRTNSSLSLEHLFLGPPPNITISMNSLTMFLSKRGIRPDSGISYCQIPYRAR